MFYFWLTQFYSLRCATVASMITVSLFAAVVVDADTVRANSCYLISDGPAQAVANSSVALSVLDPLLN